MSKNSKDEKSFNELIEEFESIVTWFESDEVDLDSAVEKFEHGMKLAEKLKSRLQEVENTIEVIKAESSSEDAA